MFVKMEIIFIFIIFLSNSILQCSTQDVVETTLKTVFIETTPESITIITDIPEEDVEEALNLDYGRYSTMTYAYDNAQDAVLRERSSERCFNDMLKCNTELIVNHPVCVYNIPSDVEEGYRTFMSYCDVYFDNCLRRMRFWRIFNFGQCDLNIKQAEIRQILKTRRHYMDDIENALDKLIMYKIPDSLSLNINNFFKGP